MRMASNIIGVLLVFVGGVWFLQGINVLPGSFLDPPDAVGDHRRGHHDRGDRPFVLGARASPPTVGVREAESR